VVKIGRPRNPKESILISAKITYKEPCYELIRAKLKENKISKSDIVLKALNILAEYESGELYAKFLPKALEELKLSVVDLNNVSVKNEPKQVEPIAEKAVVAPVKVEEKQTSRSFPNIEIQKQEEQEKDSLDDYTDEELEEFLKMLKR